jgi:hypothetical protein
MEGGTNASRHLRELSVDDTSISGEALDNAPLRSHIEESQRRGEDRIEQPLVDGSSRSDGSVLPNGVAIDAKRGRSEDQRAIKIDTEDEKGATDRADMATVPRRAMTQ